MAPDPANNRIYFLGLDVTGTSLVITAYDSQTFIQVGSVTVQNVYNSSIAIRNFIRYGADGLAFNTSDGKIYMLSTSLLVPTPPTPVPTPVQLTSQVQRLSLTTGDLAYDPSDGMIYASVPSHTNGLGAPITFGNSIVRVNPTTGAMGSPVFAGSEPKQLAISGNAQSIYVAFDGSGAICQLNPSSQAIGGRFSLGNDAPFKGPRYVEQMKVAPGTTGTLAISRMHKNGSPRHVGVAIYDDGIQRPVTTASQSFSDINNVIAYSNSAATLYGYNIELSSRDFHRMSVDSSGVSIISGVPNRFESTDLKLDNGLLYATSGQVINPDTATVVGSYTGLGFGSHLVLPESATGRVFFLVDNSNGTATVRTYDQATFALIGLVNVPGINGNIASFIRCGTGCFTFRTTSTIQQGNQLFIVREDSSSEFPRIQLSAISYTANEGQPRVDITVARSGNTTAAASVDFATSDNAGTNNCNVINGQASARCDYLPALGTLHFAANETTKNISIPIVGDAYADGPEFFTITLSNPAGVTFGSPAAASIRITDNETVNGTNTVDQSAFFVRQHYLDFLNREPDASGLNFWIGEIENCAPKPQCTEIKRINVSAAFYLAIEFQETGYLVERLYKTAYGDAMGSSTFGGVHQLPVPIVRFSEFLPDTQAMGQGVVVGQPGWEQVLETNKQNFTTAFAQRARFTTAYPASLTPAQFVDTLNTNAGNPLSPSERNQLVSDLTNSVKTRAQVLRAVAEDSDLNHAETNRARVLMQYFGYLRRNPNDQPDADYSGYDFWLDKLNQFNGNFVNAEMVKAFILSSEYRQRFGP